MKTIDRMMLAAEISDMLFEEAELLADRHYERWLELLAEDMTYRMFLVRNLPGKSAASQYYEDPLDVSWFDEDKEMLHRRVQQIRTGQHWAEEPPSRTTRLITNLRIHEASPSSAPERVTVRYNFLINRNRNDADEDTLCGTKIDALQRSDAGWRVKDRKVYINQPVILMGNLSFFV